MSSEKSRLFQELVGITLREATDADRDFLFTLFQTARDFSMLDQLPAPLKQQMVQMQFNAAHSSYAAHLVSGTDWIIQRDGEQIGRILVTDSEHELRLVDIIVAPAARGQGVGSILLSALCAYGDAVQKPVYLSVAHENVAAQRLYLAHGFTEISRSASHLAYLRSPTGGTS